MRNYASVRLGLRFAAEASKNLWNAESPSDLLVRGHPVRLEKTHAVPRRCGGCSRSFKDNFADVAGMSLGGFWELRGGLWEIKTLPSASQIIPSNSQIIPSFSFVPSSRCRLLHFIFVSCTIKRTKSPGRLYVRFLSRVD